MIASSSGSSTQLTSILECGICIEVLENPKILACGHTFCKDCLDSLLEFNDDGSCHITCPNRCRNKTCIDTSSTANDLNTNYIAKNLLDTLYVQSTSQKMDQSSIDVQEMKQPLNKCSSELDCLNEGSLYCSECKMVFCNKCARNHTEKTEFHELKHNPSGYSSMNKTPYYFTLKIDRKDGKTKIICQEHNTLAEYYCTGYHVTYNDKSTCNTPICLYCKERKHRSPAIKTINEQLEINKKEINELKKDIKIYLLTENLKKSFLETERSIASIRQAIQKEIKYRKVQQLVECVQKLDRGEIELIQRFDQIAQEQLEKLLSCEKHISDKKDFEILVNNDEIIREMMDLKKPITKLSVGLSETSLDYPLGNITTEQIEEIDFSARPIITRSIVDSLFVWTARKRTKYLENLDIISKVIKRERSGRAPDIESKDEPAVSGQNLKKCLTENSEK